LLGRFLRRQTREVPTWNILATGTSVEPCATMEIAMQTAMRSKAWVACGMPDCGTTRT
jgi:hypothetical protein